MSDTATQDKRLGGLGCVSVERHHSCACVFTCGYWCRGVRFGVVLERLGDISKSAFVVICGCS